MPSVRPAMKHFMLADRFAVLGRVMTDPSRYDHKVYKWYTARGLPVTPVKHEAKMGEEVEGVRMLSDLKDVPDLSNTSISIIINPVLGLPILKSLFPVQSATSSSARNGANAAASQSSPHAVWFQPGAADEHIKSYVRENGLEGRVVLEGCVLVSGDQAREAAGQSAGKGRL